MKVKRLKKKSLNALGIAVVLAIGVGLLTVFATTTAAANVSVSQEEGIYIDVKDASPTLHDGFGFGRAYDEDGSGTVWRINPNPNTDNEVGANFRLTITQHSDVNDLLLEFSVTNESGNLDFTVYGENGVIGNQSSNNFYLNPGSGSTTIYAQITVDDNSSVSDNLDIDLDSASWANDPLSIDSNGSVTLVASGKALE